MWAVHASPNAADGATSTIEPVSVRTATATATRPALRRAVPVEVKLERRFDLAERTPEPPALVIPVLVGDVECPLDLLGDPGRPAVDQVDVPGEAAAGRAAGSAW